MGSQENEIGRDPGNNTGIRYNSRKQPNSSSVHSISKLRCIYTNIDSIKNKVVLFRELIVEVKPHIIFITETKLGPDDHTTEFLGFKNYVVYRKDREKVDGGGGVAILVKK